FQEDFGSTLTPRVPSPVSLFGKWYNFGRQRDNFILIIAASRGPKKQLSVKHFCRAYAADMNLRFVKTLDDVFEVFASKYGWEFELAGWRGKFLTYYRINSEKLTFKLSEATKKHPGKKVVNFFVRRVEDAYFEVAFGMGVDLYAYSRDL